MFKLFRHSLVTAVVLASLATVSLGQESPAADSKTPESKPAKKVSATPDPAAQGEVDPLKRQISDKQRKENERAFKKEVGSTYKKWLDEDVRWIITDEERATFKQLSNNEERDNFIENFWLRRDPTPDTVENEFKEEHYRRIAYANERFAAGIPGWKTDRGRIYIMYGPADQIDSHPSGGAYQRPVEEGGGQTSTYPFENWRYRYLEGIGQEIEIEFVDTCMCGEYHMTMDRSEKDALLMVPGAGLTDYEAMGLANKSDRFNGNYERLGAGPMSQNQQSKFFDRLETFSKLMKAPPVKFRDLEEVVNHKISFNLVPFDVRTDFIKITSDTILVPVTVQIKNKDITFVTKDDIAKGVVNIFGRVQTLTGRIVQTFEDTVEIAQPAELLPKALEGQAVYPKALPLRPGRYRMDIVVKDVNGDRVGTWTRSFLVPDFSDEKLTNSTLIVADQMEKVPLKNVGTGNFVIGDTKVRPRVDGADGRPASFKKNQKANFWMQVYNLSIDEQTKKPNAMVQYDVTNTADNKSVIHAEESTDKMGNVGDQLTLEKSLSLNNLPPGTYQIKITVKDQVSKQTISPSARFSVE